MKLFELIAKQNIIVNNQLLLEYYTCMMNRSNHTEVALATVHLIKKCYGRKTHNYLSTQTAGGSKYVRTRLCYHHKKTYPMGTSFLVADRSIRLLRYFHDYE